ncbi:hypothetical protein DPMN_091190 [Dreissena polymorpha]|uniref:Uncharacterized protein n=1 Tax=Dreissena polymorpha TaxID=45954 RepID=A0A9D4QZS7_DREPO|nr:hypothetical protein DPMN_091190 [Dreissena polymorpha]
MISTSTALQRPRHFAAGGCIATNSFTTVQFSKLVIVGEAVSCNSRWWFVSPHYSLQERLKYVRSSLMQITHACNHLVLVLTSKSCFS